MTSPCSWNSYLASMATFLLPAGMHAQVLLSSLKDRTRHSERHTSSWAAECPSYSRQCQGLSEISGYRRSQSFVNQALRLESAESPTVQTILCVNPPRSNPRSQIAVTSYVFKPPARRRQAASNITLAPQTDAAAALLRAAPASACGRRPGGSPAHGCSAALEIDPRPPLAKSYAAMLAHGVADIAASSVPSPTTAPASRKIRRLKAHQSAVGRKVMTARRRRLGTESASSAI